jgi:DNA-binding XRE family transcriptional regulator
MKSKPDYLDELIERHSADPAFAAEWTKAQTRINLAVLRKKKNLTQEAVALKMGVSRPRVSEIESNPFGVSFGRMMRYAEAIGVSIGTIEKELHKAS